MSRPDVLERLPFGPERRAKAVVKRAAWEPDARDREIVRLRDEEGLRVRDIAPQVGVSPQRVSYLYRRYWIRIGERERA